MGMTVGYYTSAYLAHIELKRMLEGSEEEDDPVTKCPSCGSREFREHNMVRICSYCRSEG